MKPYAFGAAAVVVWTAVVFFVGRATIPDRTAEVERWRARAAVVLDSARQDGAAREAEAARRDAVAAARADSAEARLAAARRRAAQQAAQTTALEAELATVATLADTARVQAEIITSQRVELRDLRTSLADAQEAIRDLRMDLQAAWDDRQEVVAENQRLAQLLAEGIEATRPSRGKSRPIRCVLGGGVTTGGSGFGGMCGLAVL